MCLNFSVLFYLFMIMILYFNPYENNLRINIEPIRVRPDQDLQVLSNFQLIQSFHILSFIRMNI